MNQTHTSDCETATLSKALPRAFFVALLLTGSPVRAERALLEAIEDSDFDVAFEKELCLLAACASLRRPVETSAMGLAELESALRLLSPELQNVMLLRTFLRQCFVLRFFIGLSVEICAQLLALTSEQVCQRTLAALYELSGVDDAGVRG
jgi:hypothetical protein